MKRRSKTPLIIDERTPIKTTQIPRSAIYEGSKPTPPKIGSIFIPKAVLSPIISEYTITSIK